MTYWINAEEKRPKSGQEIIFNDIVGMFRGIYYNHGNGVVQVDGKKSDTLQWHEIDSWIEHPLHK